MSRQRAEGATCEVCRRRLLAGETFCFMDDPTRRRHRRPVCALCERPARERGWTRTVQLPAPEFPLSPPQTDPDAGAPDQVAGSAGGVSPSQ